MNIRVGTKIKTTIPHLDGFGKTFEPGQIGVVAKISEFFTNYQLDCNPGIIYSCVNAYANFVILEYSELFQET